MLIAVNENNISFRFNESKLSEMVDKYKILNEEGRELTLEEINIILEDNHAGENIGSTK